MGMTAEHEASSIFWEQRKSRRIVCQHKPEHVSSTRRDQIVEHRRVARHSRYREFAPVKPDRNRLVYKNRDAYCAKRMTNCVRTIGSS